MYIVHERLTVGQYICILFIMSHKRVSRQIPGFGAALRKRLDEARMTQVELASAAHLSRQTVIRALRDDLVSKRTEDAIEAVLARVDRSAPKSQFRPPAGWARATDLNAWATRRESQADFPDVVRGLVRLTARSIRLFAFRSGEGVQIEGWDGRLIADGHSPFVPDGESVWEIGTSADVADKAQRDYQKRTASPLGIDPGSTTFVFVTPRRWPAKEAWVADRKAEKIWRNVVVLDADDLEQWLQDVPSVHLRLSRMIGTMPVSAVDLPNWWDNWSNATMPRLTEKFVLAGRKEQSILIEQALSEPGVVVGVRAESRDEAIAVVTATMMTIDKDKAEDYLARSIVVDDMSAWRTLVTSPTRLILFPRFDVGDAVGAAVRAGHTVVVPLSSGDVDTRRTIALPPVARSEAAAVLKAERSQPKTYATDIEDDRLAALARRSMSAMRRQLAVASQLRLPAWSRPEAARDTLPVFFAGGWDSNLTGDRAFLERLANKPYSELSRVLDAFAHGTDPVARRRDSLWFLVSPDDSWNSLKQFVSDDDVERFRQAATEILSEPNPQYDMPKSDRWMAGVSDRRASTSGWLRKSVTRTLGLIGTRTDEMQRDTQSTGDIASSLTYLAPRVVRDVLRQANVDWRVWATNAAHLPALAEAAPDAFLSAVEVGLKAESGPILEIFRQETEGLVGGTSPHTGLLWALERLAWSDAHFAAVVRILAELMRVDPGGRLSNRPEASLRSIFRPWMPQTSASAQRRLSVLRELARTHDDIAWKIALATLPEFQGVGFFTARPEWRDWVTSDESVRRADYEAAITGAVETLLLLVKTDGDRWSELIAALPHLGDQEFAAIANQLDQLSNVELQNSEKISTALREVIASHRAFPDAGWAMNFERLARLDALRSRFGFSDVVAANAWLFTHRPQLLDPKSSQEAFDEYDAEVEEERLKAMRAVGANQGLSGALRLAAAAEQPQMVGSTAAKSSLFDNDEAAILIANVGAADQHRADFARGFAGARIRDRGVAWLEQTLSKIGGELRAAQKADLISLLDTTPDTWRLAASMGEQTEREYWQRVWHVRSEHVEAAVEKLVRFERVGLAAEMLGLHAHGMRLDAHLILDTLNRVVNGRSGTDLPGSNFGYTLHTMLEQLRESPEISQDDIAQIEWALLPLFRHGRIPKSLNDQLSRRPQLFVELISSVFRAEGESAKDPEEISEQQREVASRAYSLLRTWRTVPGIGPDGSVNGDVLREWVRDARQGLSAVSRLAIGDQQIGQMLSGGPIDADGTWPGAAIRAVIEEIASEELERGFAIGKFNSRGVVSRSIGEGGHQEREIAKRYQDLAEKVEDSAPRTARLLREMAKDYLRDADREDREAGMEEDLDL